MYATLTEEQRAWKARRREETQARWTPEQVEYFGNIWKQRDGREFLRETNLPVLSLWGDRNLNPRPTLEQLAIPDKKNIEVRWIEGVSHSLPLERPEEMAEAIRHFVEPQSQDSSGWNPRGVKHL